ncbi:MAG: septum formation protein Maf [Anaerolineae bacterium]|nr:MAG: septum formation protein Maf [Anaerolineae bacterium]
MTNLLLASQSPRRRELLALLGMPFEVAVPNVAEVPQVDEPPAALIVRLSQVKAQAVGRNQVFRKKPGFKKGIIIACDTVVALDGEVLGKPHDVAEANTMLHRLRGRSHTVYSAVTLLETTTGHTLTDVAETQVTIRAYTDPEISAYVASGDPLDKAGAYAIQHSRFHPVAGLQGCYANVVGLPLCHLTRCLRAWGIEPRQDVPAVCQGHTGHDCAVYATILAGQPNWQMIK